MAHRSTPTYKEGSQLMGRAWLMRYRLGVRAAAAWLAAQGMSEELAIFALVGSRYAHRYGVRPDLVIDDTAVPKTLPQQNRDNTEAL